jgi:fatty acid desaturase
MRNEYNTHPGFLLNIFNNWIISFERLSKVVGSSNQQLWFAAIAIAITIVLLALLNPSVFRIIYLVIYKQCLA